MDAFFEAVDLAFSYPGRGKVLDGASLSLGRGEVCTVLGRNGVGKTTLLNCLGGLHVPTRGHVSVGGRDIASISLRKRAQIIGLVPQLQPGGSDLSVIDYLVLGNAMRVGVLSTPSEEDYGRAERAMEEFGIESMAQRGVSELSGGERQQVEIARVLVQDTDVILMDEPTNHLDYANQVKVLSMVRRLSRDRGKTVILTSHMPDQAIVLGGTVALMDGDGRVEVGSGDEMLTEERLRAVYRADIRVVYVPELGRRVCAMGEVP